MKWVLSALGLAALFSLPTVFAGDCATSFDQGCLSHASSGEEIAADEQRQRESKAARAADEQRHQESGEAKETWKAEQMKTCLFTAGRDYEGQWAEKCLLVAESTRARIHGCLSEECKKAGREINDNRNCSLSREHATFLDRRYEDAKDDCFQLFR